MNSDKNPGLIKRMISSADKQHGGSFFHTTSGTSQSAGRFSGDRRFVNPYKTSEIAYRRADPKSAREEDQKEKAKTTVHGHDTDNAKTTVHGRDSRGHATRKDAVEAARASGRAGQIPRGASTPRNLSAPTSRVSSGFAPSRRRGPVA